MVHRGCDQTIGAWPSQRRLVGRKWPCHGGSFISDQNEGMARASLPRCMPSAGTLLTGDTPPYLVIIIIIIVLVKVHNECLRQVMHDINDLT